MTYKGWNIRTIQKQNHCVAIATRYFENYTQIYHYGLPTEQEAIKAVEVRIDDK